MMYRFALLLRQKYPKPFVATMVRCGQLMVIS
jgi:hypothetical protein